MIEHARNATRMSMAVAIALSLATACALPASADIILLDEYWTPELLINDVGVVEVDTAITGDPSEAKFGEVSALLQNNAGWPNVRFGNGATIKLSETPPGETSLSLWYRTDAWDGAWRAEIWVYHDAPGETAPVKVLEGLLDCGGEDGVVIADDEWHEARALLTEGDEYARMPKDLWLTSYIWLAPAGGWDTRHRTYIDRVVLETPDEVDEGVPPVGSSTRVRPQFGRQTDGPGWVWWEGEDAVEHDVPSGGPFLPYNIDEQAILSNGAWLQHYVPQFSATWEINVAEEADYEFWSRSLGSPFMWRFDDGQWRMHMLGLGRRDEHKIRDQGDNELSVSWARLGDVELTEGLHTLQIRQLDGDPDGGLGFDCWLLSRDPFKPDGITKP